MRKKNKNSDFPRKKGTDIFRGNILCPWDFVLAFSILVLFFLFIFCILGFCGGLKGVPIGIWLVLLCPMCVTLIFCGFIVYVGRHAHELPAWLVLMCFRKEYVKCTLMGHDKWRQSRKKKRRKKDKKMTAL